MSSTSSLLLSFLLNSLWQVPLLFGVAWVATRLLAPLGNAVQHRVWVSALLLESILPALSATPSTLLQYLRLWRNVPSQAGSPHVTVVVGPANSLSLVHLPVGLLSGIALLYTVTLAFVILRFGWRAWWLLRLRNEAQALPLTEAIARCWSRCSKHFHLRGAKLVTSSAIFGPVTLGLRRPLILLPRHLAETLSEDDLETVLAHEFAHLARHDFLKNLLYELLALPIAYHPLLWLTRVRLVESREMVCDERAARLTGREKVCAFPASAGRLASPGRSIHHPLCHRNLRCPHPGTETYDTHTVTE